MTGLRPTAAPRRRAAAAATVERHSLRQNAAWMFAGQGITWVLTALTLALLPRYLGPARMGSLGIGLSFSVLAAVVAGLGMSTLITREIARDREAGRRLLATALWLQVGLGLAGAVGCIGLGFVLGYGRTTQLAIAVNAATVPFNLVILLGFGALQGAELMRHQAIWVQIDIMPVLLGGGLRLFENIETDKMNKFSPSKIKLERTKVEEPTTSRTSMTFKVVKSLEK